MISVTAFYIWWPDRVNSPKKHPFMLEVFLSTTDWISSQSLKNGHPRQSASSMLGKACPYN